MSKKLNVGSKVRIPRAPELDYEDKKWIIFAYDDFCQHVPCYTRHQARYDLKRGWLNKDRYARVDKYTPKYIFATVAH